MRKQGGKGISSEWKNLFSKLPCPLLCLNCQKWIMDSLLKVTCKNEWLPSSALISHDLCSSSESTILSKLILCYLSKVRILLVRRAGISMAIGVASALMMKLEAGSTLPHTIDTWARLPHPTPTEGVGSYQLITFTVDYKIIICWVLRNIAKITEDILITLNELFVQLSAKIPTNKLKENISIFHFSHACHVLCFLFI